VERLRTTARKDHELERKEEEEEKEVSKPVRILSIAWGLECRDGVFSVEMERRLVGGQTVFSGTKKTLEISSANAQPDLRIRISFHSIRTITVDKSSSPPSLYLTLNSPPSYELHHPPPPPPPPGVDPSRPLLPTKRSSFDDEHARIAPYVIDLRIEFPVIPELDQFLRKASKIHLGGRVVHENSIPVAQRNLYSLANFSLLDRWYRKINISLAIQADALVRNSSLDPTELLALRLEIERMVRDSRMGVDGAVEVLRRFSFETWRLSPGHDDEGKWQEAETTMELLREISEEFVSSPSKGGTSEDDLSLFHCVHLVHTPTSFFISGRQPERTNRIIRKYFQHRRRFLRVSFRFVQNLSDLRASQTISRSDIFFSRPSFLCFSNRTELHELYQLDREIQYVAFLQDRIGGAFKKGIKVGGREFEFLGYSGSSLKDHGSVLFAEGIFGPPSSLTDLFWVFLFNSVSGSCVRRRMKKVISSTPTSFAARWETSV